MAEETTPPVATPPPDNSNEPPKHDGQTPPSASEQIDAALKDDAPPAPTPPPADDNDPYKGINLNGEDAPPKDGEPPKDEPQPAQTDDDYIKALDIGGDDPLPVGKDPDGNDVTFNPAEARAIAPALNKLGIPADKARGVMAVYAHIDNARRRNWEKHDAEVTAAMAENVRKELGPDMGRTLRDMRDGCRHVFSDTLWRQLQTVKPLMYNTDFIRAMAKVGRDYAIDRGADGAQAKPKPSIADDFTAERWMKGSSNANRQ